jgi:hypothetical protein
MGVIIGFVLGYLFGARSGEEGLKEIEEAVRTITSSEEMRDIAVGALSVGRDLLRQGAVVLASRLAEGGDRPVLRRVA